MKNTPESGTYREKEKRLAALFILPSLAVFLVFMFYPLAYTLYLSFFRWNMVAPNMKFVALQNYIHLLTDPVTLKVVQNTLLYIVILVLFNFLLPYVLSFINTFLMKRGKHVYKALLFSSSLIALVVGAILFQWIFNPVSGPGRNAGRELWDHPSGMVQNTRTCYRDHQLGCRIQSIWL